MISDQIVATSAVSTGGTAAAILAPAAWAGPIGLAVAGVALALTLYFNRKRPAQKVQATQIVDDLESLLKQNIKAYMEGPRTPESQAQALRNFDDAWAWLCSGEACGDPKLGPPGEWCITDRSPGGTWDWFSYYRDPIAQDTPPPAAGFFDSFTDRGATQGNTSAAGVLLPLALIGVALTL